MPEMEEKCSNFSVAFNKDYVFKKKKTQQIRLITSD